MVHGPQDPGSWILDPGSRNQDPGSWIQDPGPWILDPATWTLEPGSWLAPGVQIQDAVCRTVNLRNGVFEIWYGIGGSGVFNQIRLVAAI